MSELTFRQKILKHIFDDIQLKEPVTVYIRPEYQSMWKGNTIQPGHVIRKHMRAADGTLEHTLGVQTDLGQWYFNDNGISVGGQASLSIRSRSHYNEQVHFEHEFAAEQKRIDNDIAEKNPIEPKLMQRQVLTQEEVNRPTVFFGTPPGPSLPLNPPQGNATEEQIQRTEFRDSNGH